MIPQGLRHYLRIEKRLERPLLVVEIRCNKSTAECHLIEPLDGQRQTLK